MHFKCKVKSFLNGKMQRIKECDGKNKIKMGNAYDRNREHFNHMQIRRQSSPI